MYFKVEDSKLRKTTNVEIDCTKYRMIAFHDLYDVYITKTSPHKFLIDFGLTSKENGRDTIICNDIGELITALRLVRQAFDGLNILSDALRS